MENVYPIVTDYLSRYLEGKTVEEKYFLHFYLDKNQKYLSYKPYMDAERIKIENEISSLKIHSERDINTVNVINAKIEMNETILEFLHDIKTFQELFQSKGKIIEIHDLLLEFSKLLYNTLKSRILEISYRNVIDQLKTNIDVRPSKDEIISEIIKNEYSDGLYEDKFADDVVQQFATSVILKHFGYKYEKYEAAYIWSREIKSKKLEQFEKKLGKKVIDTIEIPDFSLLTGEQFEIFLSNFFEKNGYMVSLTPSTGDQGADLILLKDNKKTVIQAKCYSSPVGNGAIQEIVAAIPFYSANKAMVITNSVFTPSAIELAKVNGVELWDGNMLIKNIEKTNAMIVNRSIDGK